MIATASPLFTGCAAALITPFQKDGSLDEEALRRLIARQKGMDALVVLGTTGEPCSVSMKERERIISIAVEEASMPVIVGTGSNDTRKAIELAKQAKALGADGQLSVTPYYNKTSQQGLIRHFSAVLDSCDLPMILYNVPARTGLSMQAQTVAELAVHPNTAGIKEASGDLSLTAEILVATEASLPIYCGNDELILPMMAMGACGAISVAANIAPMQVRAIIKACQSSCLAQAQAAQNALAPLIKALSAQVNPIPVKAALFMMNQIHETLRLPLTPLEYPDREKLADALKASGLLPC